MQITNTICDICYDAGVAGSRGQTVDLSWLRPGYEIDICDTHLAELQAERDKLADVWLASAHRSVVTRTSPAPRGSSSDHIPGFGVEGVDWRWSKNKTRRLKIINQTCETCGKTFDTKGSFAQHVRSHDPAVRSRLLASLGVTEEAPGGHNEHADAV